MLITFQKAVAAERRVYGRIDETPDRAGDVFDYASSKPFVQRWSADLANSSNGKNFGNLRAMHGAQVAGCLTDIRFDDLAKAIEICAHVVDDNEWAKVEAGAYTGFSPGGRYVKRWQDGPFTRYTAEFHEISLVDLPCIPSATFSLVKADGAETRIALGGFKSGLAKVGARHSKADLTRIQAMHDHAAELGADCPNQASRREALEAAAPEIARLHQQLATALAAKGNLEIELAQLRQKLATDQDPASPRLKPVTRGEGGGEAKSDAQAELDEIEAMPRGMEKAARRLRWEIRHVGPIRS